MRRCLVQIFRLLNSKRMLLSCLIFLVTSYSGWAIAQDQGLSLVSEVDDLLGIHKITVLPASDNLQGIYSRPIESDLIERIRANHHWDYIEASLVGPILTALELEQDPQKVRELARGIGVDALVALKITRGPKGVSLRLDLFLAKDGKLLAQAEVSELEQFDISSIKEHSAVLWSRIVSQIPYQGRVLSRQGLRVTVNLGKKDGINENSIVNAIQILKINRHPKFNFIVSSEKEIIGKIKLLKVDDTLSFGELILEKEKGAVGKGTKLAGLDPITYPVAGLGKLDFGRSPSGGPSHSQIAFGENPTSWVPQRPPTFGQVGASLGLGQFSGNMSLSSAGPISASNNLYPTVSLAGELWVTPDWTVRARLNQGIIPISNPRSGSNPKNLSQSLSETDIAIAYVFYSGYSVWDAKVEGTAGFAKYRLFVDNSDLRSFTTMDYSGFKFGAKGSFPVIEDLSWSVGGYVNFFLNPSMKESPVTSGSDNDASINQFGILAIHRLGERLKLESSLDFAVYSAQFTGEGNGSESATSASHRHVGLSASVYYLF